MRSMYVRGASSINALTAYPSFIYICINDVRASPQSVSRNIQCAAPVLTASSFRVECQIVHCPALGALNFVCKTNNRAPWPYSTMKPCQQIRVWSARIVFVLQGSFRHREEYDWKDWIDTSKLNNSDRKHVELSGTKQHGFEEHALAQILFVNLRNSTSIHFCVGFVGYCFIDVRKLSKIYFTANLWLASLKKSPVLYTPGKKTDSQNADLEIWFYNLSTLDIWKIIAVAK